MTTSIPLGHLQDFWSFTVTRCVRHKADRRRLNLPVPTRLGTSSWISGCLGWTALKRRKSYVLSRVVRRQSSSPSPVTVTKRYGGERGYQGLTIIWSSRSTSTCSLRCSLGGASSSATVSTRYINQ